jgi:hypothetical protein
MTDLGGIIQRLRDEDPTKTVKYGWEACHSYRGYYEQLAFSPALNVKVSRMLAVAESALNGSFTGYKGGIYTMREFTDCWIANYGETTNSIPVTDHLLSWMLGKDDVPMIWQRLRAFDRVLHDGHGNEWELCHRSECSLEIVRPGKVQCVLCEDLEDEIS